MMHDTAIAWSNERKTYEKWEWEKCIKTGKCKGTKNLNDRRSDESRRCCTTKKWWILAAFLVQLEHCTLSDCIVLHCNTVWCTIMQGNPRCTFNPAALCTFGPAGALHFTRLYCTIMHYHAVKSSLHFWSSCLRRRTALSCVSLVQYILVQ